MGPILPTTLLKMLLKQEKHLLFPADRVYFNKQKFSKKSADSELTLRKMQRRPGGNEG